MINEQVPEDEKSKRKLVDEDIVVDVTTCDSIQAYIDSDGEDVDEVFYLNMLPFEDEEEDKNGPKLIEDQKALKKTKSSIHTTAATTTASKKKRDLESEDERSHNKVSRLE